VVTVTFNSAPVLPAFLVCTLGQTHLNFILYAVDNASVDDSVALLRDTRDGRVKVIANTVNQGVAEGNNQGIRAALEDGCDAVLLLNNDTEFSSDMFARLLAGLDENHCDMTTCKMLYFDPSDTIWCAGGWFDEKRFYGAFHFGMGEQDTGQYDEAKRVTYVPTCCLLVRRSVFELVGLMDARYFVYTDDVDFLYRCLKQNLTLWYLPEVRLYHKVSSLTGGDESLFAIRFMTRNRLFFLRKHLSGFQVLLWTAHFLLLTTPKRLFAGLDSMRQFRLRWMAVFEGFRMSHD
jgi:GT2 family glycosyltransferase